MVLVRFWFYVNGYGSDMVPTFSESVRTRTEPYSLLVMDFSPREGVLDIKYTTSVYLTGFNTKHSLKTPAALGYLVKCPTYHAMRSGQSVQHGYPESVVQLRFEAELGVDSSNKAN